MFKKGQSGNPAGTKKGTIRKTTLMDNALKKYSQDNDVDAKQEIINKLVAQAIEGDTQSAKIIMDRLSPAFKPASAPINLDIRLPKEPIKRAEKLIDLTIKGDLLPDEVKILLEGMKSVLQIKEFSEIEQRIEELENAQTK